LELRGFIQNDMTQMRRKRRGFLNITMLRKEREREGENLIVNKITSNRD
jgi:hypothetical protein